MAELTLGKKALQNSIANPNSLPSPYEESRLSLDFGFEVREGSRNAGNLPL